MRVVSYNILDGGEGRADPLGEVIEAGRPDIVGLVEADDITVIERNAKRLKMDFVVGKGTNHSVALLTKWTIVESVNHALLTQGFEACLLEATIRDPNGVDWPIGVVHLHARAGEYDEQIREGQLQTVLRAFARHRELKSPHLLIGDFNSNAPSQHIDLPNAHPRTRDAAEANGGHIPRRVVEKLLAAGYVDTLHTYDPHLADRTGSFTTQHPQQRIDYIFAYGVSHDRIVSAWIEQDRLAKFASDHFPIGVELK